MDNNLSDNELKKKLYEDNVKVKVNDLYDKSKKNYDNLNRTNIDYGNVPNISKGHPHNHIDGNYENIENDPDKYKEMQNDVFDPDDPTASSALGAYYQVPVVDRSGRVSYMDGRLSGVSGPDNPSSPIYTINEENTEDFGYVDENNYNKPKSR